MPRKARIDINTVRQLFEQGLSTYAIADKVGCDQSYIVRLINKHNKKNPNNVIKVRTKSEAQKLFAEKNGHQRVGKMHSDESKMAISDTMREFFDSDEGEEAKKRMSKTKYDAWLKMTPTEKANALNQLRISNREALRTGDGSKFENFLAECLSKDNFAVEQRTSAYTPGNNFHVDIALKDKGLIIEVDGPTHWKDIYGQTKLDIVQRQDAEKDAMLKGVGFDVLRVQDDSGNTSRARYMRVFDKINEIVGRPNRKPETFYVRP